MLVSPIFWFVIVLTKLARGQYYNKRMETADDDVMDGIFMTVYVLGWIFAFFGGLFNYLGVVLKPAKATFQ
jgi:hypothetical protein